MGRNNKEVSVMTTYSKELKDKVLAPDGTIHRIKIIEDGDQIGKKQVESVLVKNVLKNFKKSVIVY